MIVRLDRREQRMSASSPVLAPMAAPLWLLPVLMLAVVFVALGATVGNADAIDG